MLDYTYDRGAVVHLGERLTGSQKVGGSNPPSSTFEANFALGWYFSFRSYLLLKSYMKLLAFSLGSLECRMNMKKPLSRYWSGLS